MEMYKEAGKSGLRFITGHGNLTVEDLWHLDLPTLDNMWKGLNKHLKECDEESLLDAATKEDKSLRLKAEIVKDIIKTKIKERTAASKSAQDKLTRDRIKRIIARKQDKELESESIEELQSRLDS